jgi:hypothetical protein
VARFQPDPDEAVLADTRRYMLQGKKIKYPVAGRCILTNRRFVFHDLGKMAPFHMQLGVLIQLMVRGKPVAMPLEGISFSRGSYGRNRNLLKITAADSTEVIMDRFDKSLEWFRKTLEENGLSLVQTGEEEWGLSR